MKTIKVTTLYSKPPVPNTDMEEKNQKLDKWK